MNAVLYWILQLTWGLPMNIIAVFVLGIVMIIFPDCKVHKNGYSIIIELGGNWGGLELGAIALCGGYTTRCPNQPWFEHTREHEFGHSIQNIIWGPLYIFVIWIPSAIRYWYQNITRKLGKKFTSTWYDSIWFEGQATRLGTKYRAKMGERF